MNEMTATKAPVLENAKHKAFADAVISGKSATQAALGAGYSAGNAGLQGYRLNKRPEVAEYIAHHQAQRTELAVDLGSKVIAEISDMAFFNVFDVATVDENGALDLDFTDAEPKHLKAVTKVKNTRRLIYDNRGNHVATEVKNEVGFADKYRGLELLARHKGLLKEPEQRVVVDVADRLLAARQRALNALTHDTEDAEFREVE